MRPHDPKNTNPPTRHKTNRNWSRRGDNTKYKEKK